jgi:hypothetical protein
MMAEDKDSTRTKMIKEAPSESRAKDIVKKGAAAISSLADRLGFTQEKEYAGKSKEELQKKAKGGSVKGYKKGGVTRADGCVKKGHTKGKMV